MTISLYCKNNIKNLYTSKKLLFILRGEVMDINAIKECEGKYVVVGMMSGHTYSGNLAIVSSLTIKLTVHNEHLILLDVENIESVSRTIEDDGG